MMELSHSLTLNVEALDQLPASKKPIFIYEWLRFLDKVLEAAQKSDLKDSQKQLVDQLVKLMSEGPGPPTCKLVAKCLAALFSIGDTFLLFETINKCNDILKNKDDSPSYLLTRLAAVSCIGAMYEKLGRMMGRSYEETVQILTKTLRNAESQLRIEIMLTLKMITAGLGSAASNVHKDIYKAAKLGLTDRALVVRSVSALCLLELVNYAPFLYISETEALAQLCFRAFDNASYEVRCNVARFLATLLSKTQNPAKEVLKVSSKGAVKLLTLEEALNVLLTGFLRGGSSFLKGTGEMIKGSSSVSREVRVGITQAYIIFVQEMGSLWLERNTSLFLFHLMEMGSSPKATGSHVEAVYSRKCVTFILRTTIGKLLGEKSQAAACKEMTLFIIKHMNMVDSSGETKDVSEVSTHVLICLLQELGFLIQSLGTTAAPLILDTHLNLIDAVVAVLLHPSAAPRLASAWCLRCICVALPSQLHPLISRCCDRLDSLKSSPEAISGYSCVIAALIGCVKETPLGIPHRTGKELFNIAEELLRSANQSPRLSLQRTTTGWLLIGSLMTLGVGVVRGLLPRMLLLWKNSFPRSSKEIESEKARGDAFTWQVTLEGRAGALASMHSFLLHCPDLSGDDTIRRLLLPIEAAILMLSSIIGIVKQYGHTLKASAATVRLRLYEVLGLLPPQSYESHYTSILKLLVSEFTLAESTSNTTTSLLRTVCHADDSVILGSWLPETDYQYIEEQLQPNSASGSGALEHDACYLFRPTTKDGGPLSPLPLGVAVIDASVMLFGKMFPLIANKHRLKMLNLFSEMVHAGKNQRQETVQTNIFTAVLGALKGISEHKGAFSQEEVKKAAAELILGGLTHPNPMLRCASGEAIGRMAQVVSDPRFVAEMAQNSFDKLRSSRDAISRTGHSLALGCLHRYVGGMGSGQHLSTSISILLALAKDVSSPTVQVWSLHALSLIADSGGPMFRSYVEPSLSLILELLLTVPPHSVEVHQCIGKCLQALITTMGPELQGTNYSVVTARWSLLCCCSLIQKHYDPIVEAEAISCLQQMHLFAPRHVNLSTLVPSLVKKLTCSHLLLRRAAVSCLRQLSQRDAWAVCEHALLYTQNAEDSPVGFARSETGLPGILFGLLDTETDDLLIQHIHHAITSMLQALATSSLTVWLTLCREVLTSTSDGGSDTDLETGTEGENDDDMAKIHAGGEPDPNPAIPPRWKTRVFAGVCVSKIISECGTTRAHFDLALAREMQAIDVKGDFLVLHLSELVRMGFMAATSDSDELRLEGLHTLNLIIEKFATTEDPEFPGHVILEQYQAQVGAALRPAFATDTAANVTAKACQVCSAWIGSGVARDLNDLRRVHQLLVSSLAKLNKGNTKGLFNESSVTLEKLAILKAWAEVYVVAFKDSEVELRIGPKEESTPSQAVKGESLLSLVTPELISLSRYWLAALKDFAFLSLPPEFSSQLPHDGGAFYTSATADVVLEYYHDAWPPLLLAASLWLRVTGFDTADEELEYAKKENDSQEGKLARIAIGERFSASVDKIKTPIEINMDRFYLLLGICFEWLCGFGHCENPDKSLLCLRSLENLLGADVPCSIIGASSQLASEVATVMHRQVLSSDHIDVHHSAVKVVDLLVKAAQKSLNEEKRKQSEGNGDSDITDSDLLGEGGETGEINTSASLVFVAMQVCLCTLVRQVPSVAPQVVASAPSLLAPPRVYVKPDIIERLICSALALLASLPTLCSPAGGVAILPSLLFLIIGVLRECGKNGKLLRHHLSGSTLSVVLHSLAAISSHPYSVDSRSSQHWCSLLQSALTTIISMAKTNEEVCDIVVTMSGAAHIILNAPASVGRPHNIQYPIINLFKEALQHPLVEVRIQCIQTVRNLFSHPDRAISTPYIHSLAPKILEFLSDSNNKAVKTEGHVQFVIESLQTVQSLISKTLPEHKGEIVGLLVGILVDWLQDSNCLSTCSALEKSVHHYSLNMIQKIGPENPEDFKSILGNKVELRLKLESAIRSEREEQLRSEATVSPTNLPHKPTIKLKTDFSNFVNM